MSLVFKALFTNKYSGVLLVLFYQSPYSLQRHQPMNVQR
jgi:hypothetical protein